MSMRAAKAPDYVVEPLQNEPNRRWEGHHATNPCSIRLSCDPRVFLGYRAGGWDDRYCIHIHEVWASHLGLAVLDPGGERVEHRFPLPIYTVERPVALPQTRVEFEAYQRGPHAADILVLHDFRFWEDDGWLYMIYHEGTLVDVFDCIVRMPVSSFIERVDRSIEVFGRPVDEIRDMWRSLWWAPGVWEPAGVGGTNRIYPAWATKNDIVFLRLTGGGIRMLHRPVPDIAVVDTSGCTFCPACPDGAADFGTLRNCVRPGYFDNSHIGNNGTPIRAWVGDVPVFLDIVHGVHNRTLTSEAAQGWQLYYLPYLRLLDAATGECIYWSEEPILGADDVWREYVEQGEWVRHNPALEGVMFAGGQVESEAGHAGLDDRFHFYTGVGDTAVARASFVLRDLLPPIVVEDIVARTAHRAATALAPRPAEYPLGERIAGWEWAVVPHTAAGMDVAVRRRLRRAGPLEEALRPIGPRPGYFDADGLVLTDLPPRKVRNLGWVLVHRGVRWDGAGNDASTTSGLGLLVLDRDNPERIIYRSNQPLADATVSAPGWTSGSDPIDPAEIVRGPGQWIPRGVRDEIRRTYRRRPMPTDMTRWFRIRAGLERAPR